MNRLLIVIAVALIGLSGCNLPFLPKPKPTVAAQTSEVGPKTEPQPATQPAPTIEPKKAPAPVYVDASKGQEGNLGAVRATVTSVRISPVTLNVLGESSKSDQPYLLIGIRLKNTSDTRKVNYSSYNNSFLTSLVLKDNFGNTFSRVSFGLGTEVVGQAQSQAIYPGKYVDDGMVFERPIDKAEYLLLTLSGENVEGPKEGVVFVLHRSMWTK